MNFNKMFQKSFSDISPVKSDNELFKSVVERTENMNKKKLNIRKTSAIIAAAAAVLLLGITAAACLDIPSVLEKSVNERAAEMEKFKEGNREIAEIYYPEIAQIKIPEEAILPETETEIKAEPKKSVSERISHEYEKTIKCSGYNIDVKGYAYDGYGVQIFMDVIFDENGKYYENGELTVSDPGNLFTVLFASRKTEEGVSSGGTGRVISVNGNTVAYHAIFNIRAGNVKVGTEGLIAIIIPNDEMEEIMQNEDPKDYSIPLDIAEISDLIYDESMDREFEFVGIGTGRLKKLTVSPLQITLQFDRSIDFKLRDKKETPCYVTMKNGEVLDLSYSGTRQTMLADRYELCITVGDMAILDVGEIKTVQIYNEIFEIK